MLGGTGRAIGKARKLRREMTLPEVLLWQQLRQRPGGYKFRRQHPAGPFILDFACMSAKLAIEVDGEVHSSLGRAVADEARDEWLINQGFRTMRIPAREILRDLGAVVEAILAQCQPLHQPPPAAGPPPRTGEDL